MGRLFKGGEVIELVSDLGGGKTTLVRGLAKGIGSQDRVTSPTFTLARTYKGTRLSLHHFDFYRLSEAGVMNQELQEFLEQPNSVVVIEWSGLVKRSLPSDALQIELIPDAQNPDHRTIIFHFKEPHTTIIENLRIEITASRP